MAAELVTANIADIPQLVAKVHRGFASYKTLSVDFRLEQLNNLKTLLEDNRKGILSALYQDLHKNANESLLMEYNFALADLVMAINELPEWTAIQHKSRDFLNKLRLNSVYVKPEPYGVVLCISPWNYPFQLLLLPLIGIIAAGNCAVLKPSEVSIATSNLFTELIPKYLDQDCYVVIPGSVDVSQALLKERFNYIFYTGSTQVGKIVMKHAAETLTPVTLELGGKSPALLALDANVDVAARRIIWAKCLNSGQTCIAPDYVICTKDQKDALVAGMKMAIKEFYGEDLQRSEDYGRIINARHFKRLVDMLKRTDGNIVHGGDYEEASLYMAPTLITDVQPDDSLMEQEIFGPLLPFVFVDTIDEAIHFINKRDKPLAFYIFTESSAMFNTINMRTSAGGVVRNDILMHSAVPSLPFGGVGHSGIGVYHGKFTFDTFSHSKAVLECGTGLEILNKLRYPPFSTLKTKTLKWLLTPRLKSRFPWTLLSMFMVMALLAFAVQMYGLPTWLYRITKKEW